MMKRKCLNIQTKELSLMEAWASKYVSFHAVGAFGDPRFNTEIVAPF